MGDWREKLRTRALSEGFGLSVQAQIIKVGERLEREIAFEKFQKNVTDQLKGSSKGKVDSNQLGDFPIGKTSSEGPLQTKTLWWLYEVCLPIRIDREIHRMAGEIVKGRAWNRKVKRLEKLLSALRQYPEYELEPTLRKCLGDTNHPRVNRTVRVLVRQLEVLLRTCRDWKEEAGAGTLHPVYKRHLASLERRLAQRHGGIFSTKLQRLEVLQFALQAIGVQEADAENIRRMLSPDRFKPRRA